MNLLGYFTGKARLENPPEDKALKAECSAMDHFSRASKELGELTPKIEELKEKVKKIGKEKLLFNGRSS